MTCRRVSSARTAWSLLRRARHGLCVDCDSLSDGVARQQCGAQGALLRRSDPFARAVRAARRGGEDRLRAARASLRRCDRRGLHERTADQEDHECVSSPTRAVAGLRTACTSKPFWTDGTASRVRSGPLPTRVASALPTFVAGGHAADHGCADACQQRCWRRRADDQRRRHRLGNGPSRLLRTRRGRATAPSLVELEGE
jgi:hypothetical protein